MLALKPVRFYGNALPRPRIHEEVKLNDTRVDPPLGVNDSLLRWAANAHWSMGGTSFKRHRMQGKIEGRLKKLRDEKEEGESSDEEPPAPKKVVKPRRKVNSSVGGKLASRNKENSPPAKRRLTEESPVSPPVAKKSKMSDVTPVLPLRASPRRRAVETPASNAVSPMPSFAAVAGSPEFPVNRRRPARGPLSPEEPDSDSCLEEFSRLKDRPLRRSSRVTAIRRSFNDMVATGRRIFERCREGLGAKSEMTALF
ncbi:hypothetical protein R1sor_023245 [Riccia sorocarpa]|uniref:Uncharacterized protein n=1 Tax=Riccia sorocarpa TaxID=122646 RepID=A0ABD3GRA6_9MARC